MNRDKGTKKNKEKRYLQKSQKQYQKSKERIDGTENIHSEKMRVDAELAAIRLQGQLDRDRFKAKQDEENRKREREYSESNAMKESVEKAKKLWLEKNCRQISNVRSWKIR